MNTQTDNRSRKGSIVAAIGILVLLIGVATGSALMMLLIAAVGLIAMLIIDRQQWGRTTWLAMTIAAAIAAGTAIAITVSS